MRRPTGDTGTAPGSRPAQPVLRIKVLRRDSGSRRATDIVIWSREQVARRIGDKTSVSVSSVTSWGSSSIVGFPRGERVLMDSANRPNEQLVSQDPFKSDGSQGRTSPEGEP